MVKVIFHDIRNCSKRKEFAPSGSISFPLREVFILKKDAIEENHYLIQQPPFDVRNIFSVLATPGLTFYLHGVRPKSAQPANKSMHPHSEITNKPMAPRKKYIGTQPALSSSAR